MGKAVLIWWPPTNNDGIAAEQSPPAGTPLILKTTYGNSITPIPIPSSLPSYVGKTPTQQPDLPPNVLPFAYRNILPLDPTISTDIIRSIDFFSTADNTGVDYVVKGIGVEVDGLGNPAGLLGPITQTITGPAADAIVSSVPAIGPGYIYTQINSITPTLGDADLIQVGYGSQGITNYIFTDNNRNFVQNYSNTWSTQIFNFVTLVPTFYSSLNTPQRVNPTRGTLATFGRIETLDETLTDGGNPAFIPAFPMAPFQIVGNNTLGFVSENGSSTVWLNIANNSETDESLFFTFIQQGI